MKYSAFDRELLGVFLAIKHFRHLLEGRSFTIWTDHKPLCGALSSSAEKSPRQTRHLSYISEFSSDIRHVSGEANVVADALSLPPGLVCPPSSGLRLGDPATVATLSSLPDVVDPLELADAQQKSMAEMDLYVNDHSSSLRPEWIALGGDSGVSLLCDTSLAPLRPRPIVPAFLVNRLLSGIHGLVHQGGNALLRDVRRRYVWRNMSTHAKDFCRACLSCQRAKVTRHTKSPLDALPMPEHHFSALHLDLVGPLPAAEGFQYLLTIIDRFSRWLEAIPLASITAQDCAKALLRHWVSRFGVPSSIVTDRGRQFTSGLWSELSSLLGVAHNLTTSYHPQSNGMIERQHRTIKDRLISRACSSSSGSGTWMDHLPFVLLGLRTSIREDSACSPSDLLYGSSLRLPGDLLSPVPSSLSSSASDFCLQLRRVLGSSSLMPVSHHGVHPSRVDPALAEVSHVFLRIDAVKKPLVPPYEGPFPVLRRSDKVFTVLKNGKSLSVSIDRLKPAHFLPDSAPPSLSGAVLDPSPALAPPASSASSASSASTIVPATTSAPSAPSTPSPASLDPAAWPLPTCYGRRPRPVDRLRL